MEYPALKAQKERSELLRVFGGLDRRDVIPEGTFCDMKNLTSLHYPVLATRPARGMLDIRGKVTGLADKDGLCYTEGEALVIGGYRVPLRLSSEGEKTLVSMGAYVIVMPDKKYVNTADLNDYGAIEATVTTTETVSFSLCTADGEAMEDVTVGAYAPPEPESGALWMDTSGQVHTLKRFSADSGIWSAVVSTYVRISSPGIGVPFSVHDGVRISGVTPTALADLNASAVICACGDDYIVIRGVTDEYALQSEPVTVERRMPALDFLIESENRLWGCRYGPDRDGTVVNMLYASRLGDFKNWECFEGISTDSYAVAVGSDGAFTGAVTYLGYPTFFKEGCMHKVYGNMPSAFRVQTTACRGVRGGCAKSLATVNEVLYYVSRSGVCAYDGSLPVEISEALGALTCRTAAAGALGARYYLSLAGEENALLVYDAARGLWHREDETAARAFCASLGEMYFLDGEGRVHTVNGSGRRDRSPIPWYAETGRIGMEEPEKQRVSRLELCMGLAVGTRVRIDIQYDSSGVWQPLFAVTGGRIGSFTVPIRPRRCDHFALRLSGEGDAKLYSIRKTLVKGGA
ncbi:MAG: hypothetical protein IJV98_02065 [Clostridia bacterium]|nr:hypothetical protein [Clostridia bacterium]